jgi:class 3 adenylate cyclase
MKVDRQNRLFNVGQIVTSEMNLDALFELIMAQTNEIMETRRSTVFLHDDKADQLWSLVATGMVKNEIRIPSDHGIAGLVFQTRTAVIINDPYRDPRFYPDVDKTSGFKTENILCLPLINRNGACIGAIETLNRDGGFTEEEIELLTSLSHYVTIALENARLYEDVKAYSEELKRTLIRIETLEKVKGQLTKFVPSSVAKLVEQNPDQASFEKVDMDVSILFIDIQGFSHITEHMDERLVNDMVECHFSQYLECIHRHGGEVNETSGDGLMVIFKDGPETEHACRAVSAALDIVSENRRLNGDVSHPWGNVELHLGINSGKALVGSTKMKSLTGERWTYTASGLVTVLAARIGALSSDTRVYIGPDTFRCLQGRFESECMGEKPLKNVTEPVPIYWVRRPIACPSP